MLETELTGNFEVFNEALIKVRDTLMQLCLLRLLEAAAEAEAAAASFSRLMMASGGASDWHWLSCSLSLACSHVCVCECVCSMLKSLWPSSCRGFATTVPLALLADHGGRCRCTFAPTLTER